MSGLGGRRGPLGLLALPLVALLATASALHGQVTAVPDSGETAEAVPHATANLTLVSALPRVVRETSGLAISRQYADLLWTHNDSGDGPHLYALNRDGDLIGRHTLAGARARDWEDLALGPCPDRWADRTACLYVADTGNNDRNRNTLHLFVLPEPDPAELGRSRDYARVRLSLPFGRANIEALAVSRGGDAIMVTKGSHAEIRAYRLTRAQLAAGLADEERVVPADSWALPIVPDRGARRLVTGATFDASERLLVRTYAEVHVFEGAGAGWTHLGVCALDPQEPGGEAIDVDPDGSWLLTSEAAGTPLPSMHQTRCPLD